MVGDASANGDVSEYDEEYDEAEEEGDAMHCSAAAALLPASTASIPAAVSGSALSDAGVSYTTKCRPDMA